MTSIRAVRAAPARRRARAAARRRGARRAAAQLGDAGLHVGGRVPELGKRAVEQGRGPSWAPAVRAPRASGGRHGPAAWRSRAAPRRCAGVRPGGRGARTRCARPQALQEQGGVGECGVMTIGTKRAWPASPAGPCSQRVRREPLGQQRDPAVEAENTRPRQRDPPRQRRAEDQRGQREHVERRAPVAAARRARGRRAGRGSDGRRARQSWVRRRSAEADRRPGERDRGQQRSWWVTWCRSSSATATARRARGSS